MNTVSISKTGPGASSLLPLDMYLTIAEFVAFVTVSGTANYTIQYTLENPFDPKFNASTAVWVNIINLTALSADTRVNLSGSARAIRIFQNSGTGTTTLVLTDAGTAGVLYPLGLTAAGGGGAGNVASVSAGTTNATGPQIVFSNSNNVSFGVNGNTVTAAVVGLAVSAGTSQASSGTVVLANSNGVSFGLNGVSITASHNGLTSQSNQNVTAQNGGFAFQTLSFSNANGVSFGTSAGSAITASFAAGGQTNQTLGVYGTSNTTGQSSSSTYDARSLTFRGYGILSVGNSNGSILLSTPDPLDFTQLSVGFSTGGNTAGNTGVVTGQLVFVGSNNITLSGSTNGGSMTISIAGGAGGGGGGVGVGVSTMGNTAGTTGTVTTGNVVLVGSGPISLSQSSSGSNATISINGPPVSSLSATGQVSISSNGSTISIGVPNAVTLSGYDPYAQAPVSISQAGQGALLIQPRAIPHVQFDRMLMGINCFNSSNSSGSHTLSFWAGIYTKNASTLSLLSSASTSIAVTHSGTDGSYSQFSGLRLVSMPLTQTLSSGQYWLGVVSRTTSAAADGSYSNAAYLPLSTNYNGFFAVASNTTQQYTLGRGSYSVTTSGLPASIAFSQINGSYGGGIPTLGFASGTV